MTPTAVIRDAQVGVAGARDVDNFGRRGRQRSVVHGERERVAVTRVVQHRLRTLADRGRGAQRRGRACGPAGVVVGTDAYEAHPSNPRPFGFLNSSSSGTGPGVK